MINLVALPCLCVDVFDGTDELRAGCLLSARWKEHLHMDAHIKKIYVPMTETGFYILLCLRTPKPAKPVKSRFTRKER